MVTIDSTSQAAAVIQSSSIGSILLDMGKISEKDAERILKHQKEHNVRFGEAAKSLGFITEDDLRMALARQFDYPYLSKNQSGFSPELIAGFKPFSKQVESIRAIRTQLMLRWFSAGKKVLSITSATAEDDSSVFAANLAVVFSQLGEQTLLIDANLRTPSQHTIFNLKNRTGLSDVLANRAGNDAIVRIADFLDLSILPSGTPVPNPQELLNRASLSQLLDSLQSHYDIIIVNTGPMLDYSDAQIVSKNTHGMLVVGRLNKTRLEDINAVARNCLDIGVDIQGIVLNDEQSNAE